MAAVFIKLDGVPGKVSAPGYVGWLEVAHYSFEGLNSASTSTQHQGASRAAAHIHQVNVSAFLPKTDLNYKKLDHLSGTGIPFKEAVLAVTGSAIVEFTFRDCYLNLLSNTSGGGRPVTTMRINFDRVDIQRGHLTQPT